MLEYTRMWRERGIRSWGEGWWEMPVTVGDQLGRILGAPPGSIVMHQNVTVAEAVVLSCFPLPGRRNRVVYEEANFPSVRYLYQAQPRLEVTAVPDDARDRRRDRRTDAARPDQPCPLQERGDPGRRADHPPRARGRRARRARLLPVGRRRAPRPDGARRRFRRRRQRQVALRRTGRGLALRPARPRRAARADARRLAGPRAAVRLRAGARVRARRARVPHRHAERPGALRRDRRLRRDRGGRRAADPRALPRADAAPDRPVRRGRARGRRRRARRSGAAAPSPSRPPTTPPVTASSPSAA